MRRLRSLARRYGFDLLIVVAAIEGALEVAFRGDSLRTRHTALLFAVPAAALVVLPLLARRQLPFAAPAAVWLLGPALSFVDGRLIVSTFTVYVAGIAAAFLLGHVRDAVEARIGLVIVLAGAAIVVYNKPGHESNEFIFVPAVFAIAWLAGFSAGAILSGGRG